MINPLAALIAPLAGLALIAAASAVSVNPLLLQLVTISRNRRRRRRQLEQSPARRAVRQIQVLENFLSSTENQVQSDLLMLNYLQCGDLLEQTNHCLELLVCTYSNSSGRSAFSKQQKDVVSM